MNYIKLFIHRFFHIHDFDKWEEISNGKTVYVLTQVKYCDYVVYDRKCKICGAVQRKRKEY